MFYHIGSLGSLEVEVPTMLLEGTKFFWGASGKNTRNIKLFWVIRKVVGNVMINAISVFWILHSA